MYCTTDPAIPSSAQAAATRRSAAQRKTHHFDQGQAAQDPLLPALLVGFDDRGRSSKGVGTKVPDGDLVSSCSSGCCCPGSGSCC
jgi:hypothetical protein